MKPLKRKVFEGVVEYLWNNKENIRKNQEFFLLHPGEGLTPEFFKAIREVAYQVLNEEIDTKPEIRIQLAWKLYRAGALLV